MVENCPYIVNYHKRKVDGSYVKCKCLDCGKEHCERKYRLDCLFDNSLLTTKQRQFIALRVDADGTDTVEFTKLAQLEKNITSFVEGGHNLYLHSYTCGCGKTSWSLRLISAYFYQIWQRSTYECQALFINVPRYLLALKEQINGHSDYADFINERVKEVDLVVWDDIAAKAGTEFELNHLLSIINYRMDSGKSNIFTTNLGKKELGSALGERLASRICNNSLDIELHGADKRYLSLGVN